MEMRYFYDFGMRIVSIKNKIGYYHLNKKKFIDNTQVSVGFADETNNCERRISVKREPDTDECDNCL